MIKVSWEKPDVEDLKRTKIPRAVALGMKKGAEAFVAEELPKRFTPRAYAKYGWESSSKLYMKRKAKKKGHQKELVYSGRLQKGVTSGTRVVSQVRQVKASVRIPIQLGNAQTTFYGNLRRKAHGRSAQSPRVKLQRTIGADLETVSTVAAEETQALLATPAYRYKKTPKRRVR